MLTKIPTSAEWTALADLGTAAFLIGLIIVVLMILVLEWEDIKEEIQSIINFFKPKKQKSK